MKQNNRCFFWSKWASGVIYALSREQGRRDIVVTSKVKGKKILILSFWDFTFAAKVEEKRKLPQTRCITLLSRLKLKSDIQL